MMHQLRLPYFTYLHGVCRILSLSYLFSLSVCCRRCNCSIKRTIKSVGGRLQDVVRGAYCNIEEEYACHVCFSQHIK